MNELHQLKINDSGNYDKEAVNQYFNSLMADFARLRSVMQRNVDDANADKEAAVNEANQLKEKLEQSESARNTLESDVSRIKTTLQRDVEDANADRQAAVAEMNQLKDRLQESESARNELETDVTRIRSAMQKHIEDAEADKQAAAADMDQLKDRLQESESARSELEAMLSDMSAAAKAASEAADAEGGSGDRAVAEDAPDPSETAAIEPYYDSALMTNSGMELLAMLRNLSGTVANNDSSVVLSKSWEEEETFHDMDDDGGKMVKTIKRKSEISVKYISGKDRAE